jgi:palmitoyl-protein thioesterase
VKFVAGYSQGALLARTILQTFPEHNVHNFISLSGPQAGQYGSRFDKIAKEYFVQNVYFLANFLHLIFPDLALKSAFELFYSRVGQHTSVGNYWNDPYHQSLYMEYSQYLPFVNNEIKSNSSSSFKGGIVKLNQMILIGGPDDNVITPWESRLVELEKIFFIVLTVTANLDIME